MLKAVIFDVDGTLAETADVKRAAFNQAFAEFGLDWVWGRAQFAQIMANALPGAEVEFYTLFRHPEMFKPLEDKGLLQYIPARQQKIYGELLETGAAPLRPGIARLMAEIVSSHLKLAICSTGPRQEFETLLFNRFGLEMVDGLTCAVAAEDLQTKTSVDAYRHALRALALNPSEIIAIDDSSKGVAAAASLGMTVIATPGYYTRNDHFTGAHLILSDLGHPAAPFSVLAGNAPGIGHVSLSSLEIWHRENRLEQISAA